MPDFSMPSLNKCILGGIFLDDRLLFSIRTLSLEGKRVNLFILVNAGGYGDGRTRRFRVVEISVFF